MRDLQSIRTVIAPQNVYGGIPIFLGGKFHPLVNHHHAHRRIPAPQGKRKRTKRRCFSNTGRGIDEQALPRPHKRAKHRILCHRGRRMRKPNGKGSYIANAAHLSPLISRAAANADADPALIRKIPFGDAFLVCIK